MLQQNTDTCDVCCIATPESPASMRVTVLSDASMRAARSFCVHWRLRRAREMFSPSRRKARSTGRCMVVFNVGLRLCRSGR